MKKLLLSLTLLFLSLGSFAQTTINSLPFVESFDNYGSGMNIVPAGWSTIYTSSGVVGTLSNDYTISNSLYLHSNSTQRSYATSPMFDTSIHINNIRIKFKSLIGNSNSKLSVGVMTNSNDTSSFVEIAEISSNYMLRWEEQEILFNSYSGNGRFIAFRLNNSSVMIDDLEISYIPSCLSPINIRLNSINANSATISFIPRNNETQWEAHCKHSSDTSWSNVSTLEISTSPLFTLIGLQSTTSYDFRIKSICSTTDSSEWSYFSFFTAIDSLPWTDSFDTYGTGFNVFPYKCWSRIPHSTSIACIDYTCYSSPGALNLRSDVMTYNYVLSPKIDNSIPINTLKAKFKLRTEYLTNKLIVGVITNPNDTSTFVPIEEITLNEVNTWKDCEVFLNPYNGSGQYIALNSTDNGHNFVYVDDFEISSLPSCVRPNQLNVSNITPTSLDVDWYNDTNADHWEIEYKPYSDTSWENAVRVSNITTNQITLTNLPPSTALSLRIRAICSATDSSEWTYVGHPTHGDNFNFSYGNFIEWKAYTALNNSQDYTRSFSSWTQTIGNSNDMISSNEYLRVNSDTTENDVLVPELKIIPSGYKNSVRINYDTINNWSSAAKASKLTYDIDVDYTNYLLTLNYAIVYRQYSYSIYTGPYYSLEVINLVDSNGVYVENGRVFPDAYYDTIGVYSPTGWNSTNQPFPNAFNWKPWTKMNLDLSSKIGQKVRVKIIASKANNTYIQAYSYFAGKTEGFEEGTCYPPLTVNLNSVGSTYANISFDRTLPTDSNWVIQYREIGDSVWNYISFDTNNYILRNLSPEANYEAFIQTLCSDSTYSDSSYVFNFSTPTLYIDSMFNNQTAYLCGKYFYDDGREDNYHSNNSNYTFTICPTRKTNDPFSVKRAKVNFEEFSLGQGDVMRAYSGRSINPQTQLSIGNTIDFTGNFLENKSLIANLSDTSGCITFNLITDPADSSFGFKAYVDCIDRCQRIIADLDTFFVKYDTLGNTSTHIIKTITDSVYSASNNSWTYNTYRSVDFCEGDLIALIAKPQFPDNNSHYNQSANNCIYYWSFGDRFYDTIHYNNMVGHIWDIPKAYELKLSVLDTTFSYLNEIGCKSNNDINTFIRITQNPIKSVKASIEICSGTPFMLNVGFDTNSTIVIDSIKRVERVTGLFDSLVFIPDGPICPSLFMETSMYFDEFLPGEILNNINDLRSICINMEHSFLGDLKIELYCPTGQKVILKHLTMSGGAHMGQPIDSGSGCEISPTNLPGIGWTYCFSNQYLDSARGVISGNMPSPIDSSNTINHSKYFQVPVQNANSFATGWETPDLNGFNTLIGCPLNGEWKLRIHDHWGQDNGFIFWWKFDLGQITTWDYQSSLDTVIVEGLNNYNLSNDTVIITPAI
ncbi:MAG: fibronectin type III domain-containing protein, partial [Bacteroidales bacterium]|nr:fibronectin type III domain-containing protein [Bacteroidales bacterium]